MAEYWDSDWKMFKRKAEELFPDLDLSSVKIDEDDVAQTLLDEGFEERGSVRPIPWPKVYALTYLVHGEDVLSRRRGLVAINAVRGFINGDVQWQ
ncbi:hypothetical protein CsSME_00050835 [Camellia sinensis var. sinensis]